MIHRIPVLTTGKTNLFVHVTTMSLFPSDGWMDGSALAGNCGNINRNLIWPLPLPQTIVHRSQFQSSLFPPVPVLCIFHSTTNGAPKPTAHCKAATIVCGIGNHHYRPCAPFGTVIKTHHLSDSCARVCVCVHRGYSEKGEIPSEPECHSNCCVALLKCAHLGASLSGGSQDMPLVGR